MKNHERKLCTFGSQKYKTHLKSAKTKITFRIFFLQSAKTLSKVQQKCTLCTIFVQFGNCIFLLIFNSLLIKSAKI